MASDEEERSEDEALTFGAKGGESEDGGDDETVDDSKADESEGTTPKSESEDGESEDGEPEGSGTKGESEDGEEAAESAVDEASDSDSGSGSDSEETEVPKKKSKNIPALSERAQRYGAFGCVGLVVFVGLVFFILVKSAIDKIDDYGAVATEIEREDAPPEPEPEPEPEPRPPHEWIIEWPEEYVVARDAARVDNRPLVIVFTAEYATESIDVFDGIFRNIDIQNYLDRFYQVLHIDMGAEGDEPDQSVELCGVEFLPHVCYLHPVTEEKLVEDSTGEITNHIVFRQLNAGRVAYEASATGSE